VGGSGVAVGGGRVAVGVAGGEIKLHPARKASAIKDIPHQMICFLSIIIFSPFFYQAVSQPR
jgi:hypothetical protein